MRARLYTADGTLGLVDLVDGADVADIVRAMREHRLFITPESEPQVATTLPAPGGPEVTLPGDRTLENQEREPPARRRRSS
jgi:hypothetical protein